MLIDQPPVVLANFNDLREDNVRADASIECYEIVDQTSDHMSQDAHRGLNHLAQYEMLGLGKIRFDLMWGDENTTISIDGSHTTCPWWRETRMDLPVLQAMDMIAAFDARTITHLYDADLGIWVESGFTTTEGWLNTGPPDHVEDGPMLMFGLGIDGFDVSHFRTAKGSVLASGWKILNSVIPHQPWQRLGLGTRHDVATNYWQAWFSFMNEIEDGKRVLFRHGPKPTDLALVTVRGTFALAVLDKKELDPVQLRTGSDARTRQDWEVNLGHECGIRFPRADLNDLYHSKFLVPSHYISDLHSRMRVIRSHANSSMNTCVSVTHNEDLIGWLEPVLPDRETQVLPHGVTRVEFNRMTMGYMDHAHVLGGSGCIGKLMDAICTHIQDYDASPQVAATQVWNHWVGSGYLYLKHFCADNGMSIVNDGGLKYKSERTNILKHFSKVFELCVIGLKNNLFRVHFGLIFAMHRAVVEMYACRTEARRVMIRIHVVKLMHLLDRHLGHFTVNINTPKMRGIKVCMLDFIYMFLSLLIKCVR